MKAFCGEPSIFASARPEERQAELEVKALTLRFGGITALNEIDLTVSTGELVAVIGPNGAGKTSLLNCITGYYKSQEGRIFFNRDDITRLHTHHLTQLGIGRTFQNIELFPGMTVLSNMLLARHIHSDYSVGRAALFLKSVRREEVRHRQILEEVIDFLEMQSIRKKLVGSLPYGMRKRVELGRALALEPKLLILDEPFAGMTLEEKEDMVRFLKELHEAWGQTMILVEHDMSVVMSISQRIMVLDFGVKIAEGSPDFVQNHPLMVVEQNVNMALQIAHYGYVMENGKIVLESAAKELRENPDVKEFYLGMAASGALKSYKEVKAYKRRKRWL